MGEEITACALTWCNTIKGSSLSNICWLEHLLQGNRQNLYKSMVSSIASTAAQAAAPVARCQAKGSFRLIKMPGDGRCGWRAFLANECVEAFEAVPRPFAKCSCCIPITLVLLVGLCKGFSNRLMT